MKNAPIIACLALVAVSFIPQGVSRKKSTGPVADIMSKADRGDRARLHGFYLDLANVTSRDKGKRIPTTTVWRDGYKNSLGLAVEGTDLYKKYADLDKAIDPIILKGVGLVPVPMTQDFGGRQAWEIIAENCLEVAGQCE